MAVALKAKDHRHRPHERTSLNGVAKPERYKTHPVLGGRNGPSLSERLQMPLFRTEKTQLSIETVGVDLGV
jgi:hypothetical protein